MKMVQKIIKFLGLVILCSWFKQLSADAEWTFLTYIQADNNLWNYAYYNINDMQIGTLNTQKVNVLVQWDQPNNNRTWRYKIVNGGRIEDESLTSEMGTMPAQEIVDCASWVKSKYPAKKYAWILWNHGMGVEDKSVKVVEDHISESNKLQNSWIELPGNKMVNDRGILYDSTQNTYLSSQALNSTFAQVVSILGKKISVLGMDACLMAMIEIGYQIKDYAEVFVGSQQTEPGDGWGYSQILSALTSTPENITATLLGQVVVSAYDKLCKQNGELDYTQSAMDLSTFSAIKANIDDVCSNVAKCKTYQSAAVKSAILTARKSSLSFYISDYIDLYGFYNNMLTQVQLLKSKKMVDAKVRPIPVIIPKGSKPQTSKQAYLNALASLESTLKLGLTLIKSTVKANAVGIADKSAKGMSIYYPSAKSSITSTYKNTLFAQQSKWLSFITENR